MPAVFVESSAFASPAVPALPGAPVPAWRSTLTTSKDAESRASSAIELTASSRGAFSPKSGARTSKPSRRVVALTFVTVSAGLVGDSRTARLVPCNQFGVVQSKLPITDTPETISSDSV